MTELAGRLHRTWLQYLIEAKHPELAALALNAEITIVCKNFSNDELSIDLPPYAYLVLRAFGKNDPFGTKTAVSQLEPFACQEG